MSTHHFGDWGHDDVGVPPSAADARKAFEYSLAHIGVDIPIPPPGTWSNKPSSFKASVTKQVLVEPAVFDPIPWWHPDRWRLRSEWTGRLRWPWVAFERNPSYRMVKPSVYKTVELASATCAPDGTVTYTPTEEDAGKYISFALTATTNGDKQWQQNSN